MPMAIDVRRRHTLATLAGLSAWALAPTASGAGPTGQPLRLAAAWEQQGRFCIGLLSTREGGGQMLQVQASLEVPTRAHGLCMLADGSVVATARRPGDWLVRWHPASQAQPLWLWQNGERSFNGHVLASADGQLLYTTETDAETNASWVSVRSADTLQAQTAWPTHGIDAHELVWDTRQTHNGAPTLIVANGGVPTAPETGRVKRDLDRMDSSLVRLDARTGSLLGQWRLQDPRLSLRHLAWSPDGTTLGIALQAEHDDAAAKQTAPILACFDGQRLTTHAAGRPLAGYGGSIAATQQGWAVSCPRVDGVALFSAHGDWNDLVPSAEVCALAADGANRLWAAGLGETLEDVQGPRPQHHPHAPDMAGTRIDNHWVRA